MTLVPKYFFYLGSTVFVAVFIQKLITGYTQLSRKICESLEDFEDMSHAMLVKSDVESDKWLLMEALDNIVKQAFSSVWDELYTVKKAIKGPECRNVGLSKSIIKSLERVNYASENLGAKVVSVKAQSLSSSNFFEILFGRHFRANPPVNMLQSNMKPGNCFAFKDNRAIAIIKLPQPVFINEIGLNHISKKQSPSGETSSAPKDFTVFALIENRDILLGKFRYECIQNKLLQTFAIRSAEKYEMLRFNFNSNHGHSKYTCVYQIVVYGTV
uniref:SUN domain-containing protein n=1 Tax=Glossina brevipalpis TaxID=37001 RepID=A0A1A9WUF3_9MUSC